MNPAYLITLISSNKKLIFYIILAFSLIGMFFYINSLKSEIKYLKEKNLSTEQKLEISNISIKDLQKSIDEQNLSIQKLKEESDKKAKENAAAIAAANKRAQDFKNRADEIMKIKPVSSDDLCKLSEDLINEEILNNVRRN